MYEVIRRHPTVRQIWARELERQGVITAEAAETMFRLAIENLERARKGEGAGETDGREGSEVPGTPGRERRRRRGRERRPDLFQPPAQTLTPPTEERLRELNEELLRWPEGFTINRRLERIVERHGRRWARMAASTGHTPSRLPSPRSLPTAPRSA